MACLVAGMNEERELIEDIALLQPPSNANAGSSPTLLDDTACREGSQEVVTNAATISHGLDQPSAEADVAYNGPDKFCHRWWPELPSGAWGPVFWMVRARPAASP